MAIFSKVKFVYRPKKERGVMSAAVILEALEENYDAMHEALADLDEKELEEMREYFNSATSDGDIGDVLFSSDNTFEDVRDKINALDDEGQK